MVPTTIVKSWGIARPSTLLATVAVIQFSSLDSTVTSMTGQRADIADRIARLAHAGDHGDVATYREIYAADATWQFTADPLVGVDAIVAQAVAGRAAGRIGSGSGLCHVVTTVASDVGDAIAESDSYVLVYATSGDAPALRSIVRYHDTWRLDGDAWRLTARRISRV
jgi:hypothetical protein